MGLKTALLFSLLITPANIQPTSNAMQFGDYDYFVALLWVITVVWYFFFSNRPKPVKKKLWIGLTDKTEVINLICCDMEGNKLWQKFVYGPARITSEELQTDEIHSFSQN